MAWTYREPIQLIPAESGWRARFSSDGYIARVVCWAIVEESQKDDDGEWFVVGRSMAGMLQDVAAGGGFEDARSVSRYGNDYQTIDYLAPGQADDEEVE